MEKRAAVENYIRINHSGLQGRAYEEPEVYGNVVRKPRPASYRKYRSSTQALRANKALKKQKALFIIFGSIASSIAICLCAAMLWTTAINNSLNEDLEKLETQYNNLLKNNEDKEYLINMDVDTNYIINAAQELGMVRSNAAQIVTYSVKNNEYLQQVARVPEE